MYRLALAILAAAAVVQAAAPTMAVADDWRTYRNERYGTTIDYPDIFKAGPPPANDDGLAFKSDDGAAFSVFASFNALDLDLAGFKDFILKTWKPARSSPIRRRARIGSSSPAPKAWRRYFTKGIFCRTANR